MGSRIAGGVRLGLAVGLLSAAALALGPAGAAAQTTAAQTAPVGAKQFDVASVRPSAALDVQKLAADMQAGKMPNFGAHVAGLRAEYTHATMRSLIANAYGVKEYQVTGPEWMTTLHFGIAATMPVGSRPEDAPAMLQSLLAERFKLMAHRDTQEHPVLALEVAKGGPKMKESAAAAAPLDPDAPLKQGEMKMDTPNGPARISMQGSGATINMGARGVITYALDPATQMLEMKSSSTTMTAFADMLTQLMQMGGGGGRQVVDDTGLTGSYEVAIEFSMMDMIAAARAQGLVPPGGAGMPAPAAASSMTAAQASDPRGSGETLFKSVEALGLKLEPKKLPVEQIVVDSVEKTATEN